MHGNIDKLPSDVWDGLPNQLKGIRAFLLGACVTAGVTGITLLIAHWLPAQGIPLLYILAIVCGAVGFGTVTGLSSATLAFLAYNFFFVPPTHTFAISDVRDLFALFVFFGVAVITGSLAGHMREIAERARRHARSLKSLNGLVEALSGAVSFGDVAAALAGEISKATAGRAVVLKVAANELTLAASSPPLSELDSADLQAAQRASRNMTVVYPSAAGWPGSTYEFHAIVSARKVIAVLGVRRRDRQVLSSEAGEVLDAMIHHAAIAFEKSALESEKAAVREEAESERLRSALLSSISHDLKTPLASIQGAVSSLRELGPLMPEATRADLLQAIEEETARLSRFVTNLLDMTRVEAGQPDLKRDCIEVQDIISATVARARRLMPSAIIRLEGNAPAGCVRGDTTLLEHVIFNLLDNAVRFSPPSAPVTISVTPSDETFIVTIEDHGTGISQVDLPRIFDKFFRSKSTNAIPGTGLGLTICKRIIEGMDGTIVAESPIAEDRGTRITIRLPKAVEEQAASHPMRGVPV